MGRRSALGREHTALEPKHTTQPLPKLRRTPAAFATRENLTLTLEDEPSTSE